MVKGYEFAKDQYVTFTEDELKAMDEEAEQRHRDHRVRAGVDRWTRSTSTAPTTSAPTRAASKAYQLLVEAMRETGRSALAKWAARGKQYLVLIRPVEGRPRDAAAPLRRRGAADRRGAGRATPRSRTPS